MSFGDLAGGGSQGGYPPPPSGYPPSGYPQGGYPAAGSGYSQNGYPAQGYPAQQGQQAGYPSSAQYPYAGQQPQPMQRQAPPPTSDYLPHLRDEYRTAYDIGARDRSLGYLTDYKRAYTRFGHGFETYFQEGYNDGYSGNRMRH